MESGVRSFAVSLNPGSPLTYFLLALKIALWSVLIGTEDIRCHQRELSAVGQMATGCWSWPGSRDRPFSGFRDAMVRPQGVLVRLAAAHPPWVFAV